MVHNPLWILLGVIGNWPLYSEGRERPNKKAGCSRLVRGVFFFRFIHERHRLCGREKQAPCQEPNVGLDPRSPGLGPGLKALIRWATGAAQVVVLISRGNLTNEAYLGPQQDKRIPTPAIQTLKVYEDTLTELSYLYHAGVFNTTHHLLKAMSLKYLWEQERQAESYGAIGSHAFLMTSFNRCQVHGEEFQMTIRQTIQPIYLSKGAR